MSIGCRGCGEEESKRLVRSLLLFLVTGRVLNEVLVVEPDEFVPQAEKFDLWRLEWVHYLCAGSNYFVDSGETPTKVMASCPLELSQGNEADYEDVRGDGRLCDRPAHADC